MKQLFTTPAASGLTESIFFLVLHLLPFTGDSRTPFRLAVFLFPFSLFAFLNITASSCFKYVQSKEQSLRTHHYHAVDWQSKEFAHQTTLSKPWYFNHLQWKSHEEEEAWASFQQSERSLFETVPIASLGHQGLKMCVGQDIRSSVCIQEANAWIVCIHKQQYFRNGLKPKKTVRPGYEDGCCMMLQMSSRVALGVEQTFTFAVRLCTKRTQPVEGLWWFYLKQDTDTPNQHIYKT